MQVKGAEAKFLGLCSKKEESLLLVKREEKEMREGLQVEHPHEKGRNLSLDVDGMRVYIYVHTLIYR